MKSDVIKQEVIENILRISLNVPDKMNPLCPEMEESIGAIRKTLQDDRIKVIVTRGEGGNFCSGADIKILGDNVEPVTLNYLMQKMNSLIYEIREGPWPVIAEVDGVAIGGGLGFALSSDITYATERAKFSTGFIRIGGVLDIGSTYFLAERVGMAQARELALTGDIIDAKEALSIGLINKIVSHEKISQTVMDLAKRIAKRSKEALGMTKRNLNRARSLDLRTILDIEAFMQPIMLLSDEHKEAMRKLFPDNK